MPTGGETTPRKRIAIHQPNFNPYLGVIAKYLLADRVIHLDTVQFVKNEFQNRNKVVVEGRPHWLTVPVRHSAGQTIREVRIDQRVPWRKKHLKTLEQAYSKTPRFHETVEWLHSVYDVHTDFLVEWNLRFLRAVFDSLEIPATVHLASQMDPTPREPDNRLIHLCHQLEGDTYLAGSGGLDYMDRSKWKTANLQIEFLSFEQPVYPQGDHPFIPYCGILDLLFRFPPSAIREMALSGVEFRDWD